MIPFLIGAAAVIAGIAGATKTVSAVSRLSDAKDIVRGSERRIERAERNREQAREKANETIERLGEDKLVILSGHMKTFVDEFQKLKNVDFRDSIGLEELSDFQPNSPVLLELDAASSSAVDFSIGAVSGSIAGGAVALGAYGAVGALASASTGTAIAGLSGAAATNATLAWLGGGSLAAGGLGIAGGTAILGGIVAAPALLVAGMFMESKAEEAMAEAKSFRAESREFQEQCENNITLLKAITRRAEQIMEVMQKLDDRFENSITNLQNVIRKHGADWRTYGAQQKNLVGEAALLAKVLKILLDTPLLTENGTLTVESETILNKIEQEHGFSDTPLLENSAQ